MTEIMIGERKIKNFRFARDTIFIIAANMNKMGNF